MGHYYVSNSYAIQFKKYVQYIYITYIYIQLYGVYFHIFKQVQYHETKPVIFVTLPCYSLQNVVSYCIELLFFC